MSLRQTWPMPSSDERPWPATAEALMRSRFEAFRAGDTEWLLASWHHSTRPATLDLGGNPAWRGLQIVDTLAGGPDDDTGIVEFRATHLSRGRGLHRAGALPFRPRERALVLPRTPAIGRLAE